MTWIDPPTRYLHRTAGQHGPVMLMFHAAIPGKIKPDWRATLENILGKPVTSFAYPYGASDERCATAVMEAGYAAVRTTRTGWALSDSAPYRLRRLTAFNTDTGSLARKLYLGDNNANWGHISRYLSRRLPSALAECKIVPIN